MEELQVVEKAANKVDRSSVKLSASILLRLKKMALAEFEATGHEPTYSTLIERAIGEIPIRLVPKTEQKMKKVFGEKGLELSDDSVMVAAMYEEARSVTQEIWRDMLTQIVNQLGTVVRAARQEKLP